MKAAIIEEQGKAPVYGDMTAPIISQGMVVMDVKAAALSHLSKIRSEGSHYSSDDVFPRIAGVEGVGVTIDGQRVYFFLPESPYGALTEQTLAKETNVVRVPDELDDVTAAAIANPGMSSWAALMERAQFQAGETVLVNGATGTSGKLAVQIAKYLGAKKVIATGRNKAELQKLSALGADVTVPLTLDESDDSLANLTATLRDTFSDGIDVVIDYLWGDSALAIMQAIDQSVPDGHNVRFVNCGASSKKEHIDMPSSLLRSSAIQLMGSGLGSVPMPKLLETIGKVFEITKKANLQIDIKTVPLSEVEEVWGDFSGKPRIVFTMN